MSLAVANRYARAFVDVLLAQRLDATAVLGQLIGFEEMLRVSAPLRNVLFSPAVSPARKRSLLGKLGAEAALDGPVRNFLMVIGDHRRFGMLALIRQAVERQMDERMGLVRVRITSARAVAGEQRAGLEAALARLTSGRVRCDYEVDEWLLGGAVAQIGSTIYDGSLRGRLAALRGKLIQ
ncbi:MAG: ATP synthase F1 subunit delta [Bryobacteraceae bacterium]